MSAFTPTPSPWHIKYHGMGADGVPIIDITGPHDAEGYSDNLARLVVRNTSGSITPEIARANARLMALAPDLLMVLCEVRRYLRNRPGNWEANLNEAIGELFAKIGEGHP